jgi:hypothetical protein
MSVISLNVPATQPNCNTKLQASTWVKLRELPSPYSYDEALLLCQTEDCSWIAWIPEYGEIKLYSWQLMNF